MTINKGQTHLSLLALPILCGVLGGCSLLGPLATMEVVKSTGTVASAALAYKSSEARDLVHHGDAPVSELCIEYNPTAQLADLVPSLQIALKEQGIRSRVYEAGTGLNACQVWLRYEAAIEWDIPPFSTQYKAYLSTASFGLQRANGSLMATSSYEANLTFGIGKWAPTRRKLAPVVRSLVTGFES